MEFVGVVDSNPARAAQVAAEFGTQAFASLEELLQRGKPQAASVAVPTVAHLEVARKLMQAGVDVLIEKPVAPTLAETSPPRPPLAVSMARTNALPTELAVEELVAVPPAPARLELPKLTEPPPPPLAVPNACELPVPPLCALAAFVALPPAPLPAPFDPVPPPPPFALLLTVVVPVRLVLVAVLLV